VSGRRPDGWEVKEGVVMLTAVPLAPSLMMSWSVLTTPILPSVNAGEIGRKSSHSRYPVGNCGSSGGAEVLKSN